MGKLSESQREEIREMIVEKLGCDIEEVKDDSKLGWNLGADSLDEVDLMMGLEMMFDINIPDNDYEREMDVNKLYEIVERYIQ